ncbi:MAG: PLDc N-terminal domain-containing protein [Actinobacteria bacterium]|nr:PLDc N-terminal domain-containing protein [Actinomycetota bacterium]
MFRLVGFGGFALLFFLFWAWALIDAVKRPTDQWERAHQSEIVWILVILLGSVLGATAYLFIARPQLELVR